MRTSICASIFAVGLAQLSSATVITMVNNCPYTIWPGIIGNPQPVVTADQSVLTPGQSKPITVDGHWVAGRVWARTGCNDKGFNCATGDCGAQICSRYGDVPATLFEAAFGQWQNKDWIDISLVNGGNVKMTFEPADPTCKKVSCNGDFLSNCPAGSVVIKNGTTVGCNNFCPGHADTCDQNPLGLFFKNACPSAYSFPKDDPTSMFDCPTTDWKVSFCQSAREERNMRNREQ